MCRAGLDLDSDGLIKLLEPFDSEDTGAAGQSDGRNDTEAERRTLRACSVNCCCRCLSNGAQHGCLKHGCHNELMSKMPADGLAAIRIQQSVRSPLF